MIPPEQHRQSLHPYSPVRWFLPHGVSQAAEGKLCSTIQKPSQEEPTVLTAFARRVPNAHQGPPCSTWRE